MKIQVALTLAVIGFSIVITLSSIFGLRNVNDLSDLLKYLTGPAWDTADGAMEGTIGIEAQMIALQRLRYGDGDINDALEILKDGEAMADEALARMIAAGLMDVNQVKSLQLLLTQYNRQRDQLRNNPKNLAVFNQFITTSTELLEKIEIIEEEADGKVENESSRVASLEARALKTLTIGIALCLILSALLLFYIHRAVLMPMKKLKQNLQALAEGTGDLTVRLPEAGKNEFDEVARAFNSFLHKIQGTILEIKASGDQLKNTSDLIEHSIDHANRAIDQQHLSTTRVAAAIEEMTNILQQMTSHTQNATAAADSTRGAAQDGLSNVLETQHAMNSVNSAVDEASGVIGQLDRDSKSIASMLEIIRSIAEQTNLLALNAAIEAARAGESGRGFAVVADEVRSLASRTQESTQDIEKIINKLQQGSQNAVSVMQQAQEKSQLVSERSDVATQSLTAIDNNVSGMCDINTELSCAANEQQLAVNEISESIHSIARQSEDTHQAGQDVSNQAKTLQSHVKQIEQKLSQFKA